MTKTKKTKRGRPPLGDGKKVRLHISVAPDLAKKALKNKDGVSSFFSLLSNVADAAKDVARHESGEGSRLILECDMERLDQTLAAIEDND